MQEDIHKLVDQVSAVTTATKEIESKISGDLWDRQKQWELKRDILFDAVKRLNDVDSKLLALNTFWEHKNGKIDSPESEAICRTDTLRSGKPRCTDLRRLKRWPKSRARLKL